MTFAGPKSQMEKVYIYDTTLRDGTQGEEVSFSVEDKLKIAQKLDEFGVDYVEGGWPGSNPRDHEFFIRVRKLHLRRAKIAAFGSTRRANKRVDEDPNLAALLAAETPVVTIFGKSWLLHVTRVLSLSEKENLDLIGESVGYLKMQGREVIYDAEHFFDGYKQSPDYALATLRAAQSSGAAVIVLCDTNGGTLPQDISSIIREVKQMIDLPLGIHAHNDSELAVANSVAAVLEGAVQVQGTINGYGERTGNANLCSVIPVLQLKLNIQCVPERSMSELTGLSHFVAGLANLRRNKHLPFVGASSFAHKGGVHVSAVMRAPETYEHINPDLVGNSRRVLVSDLSGRSNITYKAEELGLEIAQDNGLVSRVVDEVKQRELQGYQYEDADGSLELLIRGEMNSAENFFDLEGFKVIVHKPDGATAPVAEALIKVRVGDSVEHTAAEGDGPINALDIALRKALEKFYPEIKTMGLADFKVRVLDGQDGTGAKVRVLITSTKDQMSWNTVGVSTDVIEASWLALVDSVHLCLLRSQTAAGSGRRQKSESAPEGASKRSKRSNDKVAAGLAGPVGV